MNYSEIFERAAQQWAKRIETTNEPTAEQFAAREEEFAPGLRGGLDYLEKLTGNVVKFSPAHRWATVGSVGSETVDELNEIGITVRGLNYAQFTDTYYLVLSNNGIGLTDDKRDDAGRSMNAFEDTDLKTRVAKVLDCLYLQALEAGLVSVSGVSRAELAKLQP